jgi:gamma-D-glutamyl-L-lysine dipeptidyl-peptidase
MPEVFGLVTISVANLRALPRHQSELKSQALLGEKLRILRERRIWLLIETLQGYRGWVERESLELNSEKISCWHSLPLLIVQSRIDLLRDNHKKPVADVVAGNVVAKIAVRKDQTEIAFPDGRRGYLPTSSLVPLSVAHRRKPVAQRICATAMEFLGVPYLWGANSTKAVDCSGFVKLVLGLNGISTPRDAHQQSVIGKNIKFKGDWKVFAPADLLIFGRKRLDGRIHHIGIYLGKGKYIHASNRVRLNSLDAADPLFEPERLRQLIGARRIL